MSRTPRTSSVPPVNVLSEQLFDNREAKARIWDTKTGSGFLIFGVTILFAAICFAVFTVITFVTYPYPEHVDALLAGATLDERLHAYSDLRTSWLQQTSALGQMMVFGSLVPVLTTIIGYALGRQSKED